MGQITFEKANNFFQIEESAQSVAADGDGNYVVAIGGKFESPQINRTFGLAKINAFGDTLWFKSFTKGYHPILREVRITNDAYYVLGQCDDSSQFNPYMIWLSKFDTLGNQIWSYNYADPDIVVPDFGLDFSIAINGNILISTGYNRFYLVDSAGQFLTIKPYYNYWMSGNDFLKPKINTKNGIIFCTALYSQTFPSSPFHPKIIKVNLLGDSIGSFNVNLDSSWGISYVSKFIGSNFLIFGVVPSAVVPNDFRYVFSFVDSLGNRIWRKRLSGMNYINTAISSHAVLQNGNIVFSGFQRTSSSSPPKAKAFLYCFNENGDSLWYKEFRADTLHKTEFYDVIATADSGILACGQILMPDSSRQSYIVKLDANGNLFNPLSVIEKKKESYLHLYPNPATDFTTIHYMGAEKNVVLSVHNLQGQIIYSKKIQNNDERVKLATSQFGAGLYIIKISVNGRGLANKKLVVVN